ncbi:MAG: two-component system response regulator [Spirochaetae bacterium HGW-Spirochaetae-1]|jgi:putative two-component system response regulator|nr:MAG: two-component system response regulator [Spirochaetae bacterium HGW-Spirochaetae-1]
MNSISPTILVIDDEYILRQTMTDFLEDHGYSVIEAENGRKGIEMIRTAAPDVVLCDLMMPEMNGLDVITHVSGEYPDIPVIAVSGTGDISLAIEAVKLGAWDYLMKPLFDMNILIHSISRAIERSQLLRENKRYQENLEFMVQQQTEELRREIEMRKTAEKKIEEQMQVLEKTLQGTVQAIVSAVELRDPYTAGHQRRVAMLAQVIARNMSLDDFSIAGLTTAGTIHDLGKLSVPSEILSKPSRLTGAEFNLVKDHARSGFELLKGIDFPWPVAKIVYQHHEKIDGSGYPLGIGGSEITPEAKILTVADVVEAIASHRPYRASMGVELAVEEIRKKRGIQYDPETVDSCIAVLNQKLFSF